MKYAALFFLTICFSGFLLPLEGQQTVKDYDGNVYKTVKIDTRVWMAENLKVTHYRDGAPIPDIKEPKRWNVLKSGAYCNLENNTAYTKAFGLLYNWYTVEEVSSVCPAGWHVPSESEWIALVSFLAGENEKGVASITATGKIAPNLTKINESMFRVLPEGFRGFDGEFTGIGYGGGGWWSATECTSETAFYHSVNYNTAGRQHMEGPKSFGYHIRCVKD